MQSKKELILGALGFAFLAYIAFWAVSTLVGQEDVTFEAPTEVDELTADLRVQILAPDGDAPEDCVATLWKRVGDKLQTGPGHSGKCPGGALAWTDLEPGTYLLEVGVFGAARYARNIELSPGADQGLGVSQLSPGGVLKVQALSPDGRGLPGAKIWLGNWLVTSDIEGRYTFAGAPVGSARVRAQFDNVVGAGSLVMEAGATESLEITLEDLTIRGILGLEFTATAEGLQVTSVAPDGPSMGVLEVDDRIVAIAGQPSLALTQTIAEKRLDGPPGETVQLTVLRGEEALALELVRADLLDVLTEQMKKRAPPKSEASDEGEHDTDEGTKKTEPE